MFRVCDFMVQAFVQDEIADRTHVPGAVINTSRSDSGFSHRNQILRPLSCAVFAQASYQVVGMPCLLPLALRLHLFALDSGRLEMRAVAIFVTPRFRGL
jgi:hypothetical protein